MGYIKNKWYLDAGTCKMCMKPLGEEEYYLGLGRCNFCARKCEEEVGFGTIYGNVDHGGKFNDHGGKFNDHGGKFKIIDNSKW